MTFEEWWNETEQYDNHGDPVKAAWDAGIQEGIERMQKAYQIRPRGKSILAHLPEGYVLVPVDSIEKAIQSAVLEFGRPNITATSVKRFAIEYAKRIKEPSDA